METQSLKIEIVPLDKSNREWFTEVAAVRMLTDELKRPLLVDLDRLYYLAMQGEKEGTAFLAKQGDVYCGAIGGILHNNLFNPKFKTLTEIFWYVLPEYRKGRAGYMLLKQFDERAKELADDVVISLLPSSEVNVNSLAKKGFILNEQAFRKEY
jgi:hypothetical protein